MLRRSARKARPASGFGQESEDESDGGGGGGGGRAPRRGNWCACAQPPRAAGVLRAPLTCHVTRAPRFRHVMSQQRDWAGASVARVPPAALTAAALRATGFAVPLAVRPEGGDAASAAAAAAALGLRLPPGAPLSVADVAAAVGPETRVPTLDVARQGDGPRGLTAAAFASYWADPAARRRRLLNCVSLSLAATRLAEAVAPPRAVAALDLVAAAWPRGEAAPAADDADAAPADAAPADATAAADTAAAPPPPPAPEVLLYALMSPAGAYTDWHVDFGGSSVWYHLLSGRKVFLLAPPCASNLAAFATWAASPAQARTFLGDALRGVQRCEVAAGDTLLIPAGWPHAVATPSDAVALGGNFLHALGACAREGRAGGAHLLG